MFGYAAYAQSPYASLGSTRYAVDVTENLTLNDTQTAVAAFVSAIIEAITAADLSVSIKIHNSDITEDIKLAELESVVAAFVSEIVEVIISKTDASAVVATFITFITENFGIADSPTGNVFYQNIAVIETINLNDQDIGIGNFASSVIEPITLDSLPIGWGWIRIDDSETTDWVLIDNRQ
jgi:hypothetical protein